jgi:Arm DNA-binding domain
MLFAVGRPDSHEFPLKCGQDCGTEIPRVWWCDSLSGEPNLMALTILKVKNAKPGRHLDGRGLCRIAKPSCMRTRVLRMQLNGQRRDFGLGSVYDVALADARTAAADLRRRVRDGFDPVVERQKARKIISSVATATRTCH